MNAGTMEIVKKVDPVHSAGMAAHAVDKDSLMEKDAQAKMAAITITVVSLIPIPRRFKVGHSADSFQIQHNQNKGNKK